MESIFDGGQLMRKTGVSAGFEEGPIGKGECDNLRECKIHAK